jgi:hypothetical protein
VYNLLAAGPDEWVAIHSLDLAPWNRGLRTEVDFIVIVPEIGVLCIEVKSQENIYFDGRRWYPDTIKRSPFKQACDGRYMFYRRLVELSPQFREIPVVHCCVFPRAAFSLPRNLSVQPWELMDSRAFRGFISGDAFCADLRVRMEQAVKTDADIVPLTRRLSQAQIDSIVTFCVPIQKHRPDKREEMKRHEEEMENALRQQQKPVLQLAELNNRLVVWGAAGTGKTLIAMEVARRASERGLRVALLCYNQLVGDWMVQEVGHASAVLPNLVVGRAIRVLAEMTQVQIPSEPTQHFWETELPEMLEERLTDPDFEAIALFDYLVLDEAQDILARPRLWQSVTHFLSGGLNNGAFALFGDFRHQVLRDREAMLQSLSALDTPNRPVRWNLSENCRNYRIIGESAVRLAGFGAAAYTGYMRVGGSVRSYDITFYEDEDAQLAKLKGWLQEFQSQGYRTWEITLLSFRAHHLSAATRLISRGYKLRPAGQSGELTAYASVHAFKGMENKVIILTDVTLDDQDFQRHVFYTGITRATECVRILCDKRSQPTLSRWLAGKSQE